MPLFVFTHTLISFFLVLSGVVGVACRAGADTGPLMRMSPSSAAATRRRYLRGRTFLSRENYATDIRLVAKAVK
jgi:hypothetical protein